MEEYKAIDLRKNDSPSHFADYIGWNYSKTILPTTKKERGQFFTPVEVAKLMASFTDEINNLSIKILDPGCGTCILSCALIEKLVTSSNLKVIELVLYESDVQLLPSIKKVILNLKKWLIKRNIRLKYQIKLCDFVLDDTMQKDIEFDFIVSNPPYFKLTKNYKKNLTNTIFGKGHTNIYSIFMTHASKILKPTGQLIFITPRSFTSGNYFKNFREYFFRTVKLERIHLFVSRKATFNRERILQETVIVKATKKRIMNDGKVIISSSEGSKDIQNSKSRAFKLDEIIDLNSEQKILHIPTDYNDELILKYFRKWKDNLKSYNIQISTGPVVSFRALQYLQEHYQNGTVFLGPLFWLNNVDVMMLNWPISKKDRHQYIKISEKSKSILIPNKNYVFLRRFSSKEDKNRLIAAPYFQKNCNYSYIGVENKLNYLYRPNGNLSKIEITGLSALLNSSLFNNYFRMCNGNVNVSATELREMPFPPIETLKKIGKDVISSKDYSMQNINRIITKTFNLSKTLSMIG